MIAERIRSSCCLPLGLAAMCCLLGCTGGDERGQRVAVRGAVLLDNEPLDRARVIFRAAEGENKVTATGSVVDGFYDIPAEYGPLVGPARVHIEPEPIELEEFEAARGGDPRKKVPIQAVDIPPKYNIRSDLVVEVTPDPVKNKFDFKLESQPGKN